jgi:serine phosphatase RsbU (regulator of sigma subunit)
MNPEGEEFGEGRLLEVLLAHRQCTVAEGIQRVIDAVHAFSGPVQSDDVTLMLIRAREGGRAPLP